MRDDSLSSHLFFVTPIISCYKTNSLPISLKMNCREKFNVYLQLIFVYVLLLVKSRFTLYKLRNVIQWIINWENVECHNSKILTFCIKSIFAHFVLVTSLFMLIIINLFTITHITFNAAKNDKCGFQQLINMMKLNLINSSYQQ